MVMMFIIIFPHLQPIAKWWWIMFIIVFLLLSWCSQKDHKEMMMSSWAPRHHFSHLQSKRRGRWQHHHLLLSKEKKRKKRKEENGAYLQTPTSAPLAFALLLPPCWSSWNSQLLLLLHSSCHHVEAPNNEEHSWSFGDGSERKRRWVGRGPAGRGR